MKNPRTMLVTVLDPINEITTRCRITKLMPTRAGLFGKIVGSNFNVFRAWDSPQWTTNISSSTRFSMEVDGMTPEEVEIFVNETRLSTTVGG